MPSATVPSATVPSAIQPSATAQCYTATVTTQLQPSTQPGRSFLSVSECLLVVELVPHSYFFQTMSNFLDDITLGLSPQDGFSEEMEVGSPTPTQEEELPGSPVDQILRDLDNDQWPSQVPEDQLMGASQLV